MRLHLKPLFEEWGSHAVDAINDLFIWREAISSKVKTLEDEIKKLKEENARRKSSEF